MGSGFLIIRLMGLHGCLMIWVGFLCWIIDLAVSLSAQISRRHSQGLIHGARERSVDSCMEVAGSGLEMLEKQIS